MSKFWQKLTADPEILLVDKPKGISSFDVIRQLRGELNIKKMGHAGTLDPLASGLMIIGLNGGTKKLTALIGLDKTYEVEIILGERSSTGDAEGEVVEKATVTSIDTTLVEGVLKSMAGDLELAVPVFSAIKVQGRRLYDLARRGESITPPVKLMRVYEFKLKGHQSGTGGTYLLKVAMSVASGTYVRSVAEELGRRLGVPARLENLRRTKIGEFTL